MSDVSVCCMCHKNENQIEGILDTFRCTKEKCPYHICASCYEKYDNDKLCPICGSISAYKYTDVCNFFVKSLIEKFYHQLNQDEVLFDFIEEYYDYEALDFGITTLIFQDDKVLIYFNQVIEQSELDELEHVDVYDLFKERVDQKYSEEINKFENDVKEVIAHCVEDQVKKRLWDSVYRIYKI